MLLKKKRTLAAKVESTIGTAETLANADGVFNAYDLNPQGDVEVEGREGSGGMDRLAGVPGARRGTLSFKTDVEWDGTTTLPAWATVLFPMCGFVNSSGVFTPRTEAPGANVKTGTIGVYEDGRLKTLAGAAGNFKIVMPAGRKCYIEWNFEGVWQPVTDTAIITPTYPTDPVLRFASATTTYDSVAQCVNELSVDAGGELKMRECSDNAAGFKNALVVDRHPMIEADPEATLVASDDRYGDWIAGSEAALSVSLDGPSTSTLVISAPSAQLTNVQGGDREKLLTDSVTWMANKNGANQDQSLSITFNEAV